MILKAEILLRHAQGASLRDASARASGSITDQISDKSPGRSAVGLLGDDETSHFKFWKIQCLLSLALIFPTMAFAVDLEKLRSGYETGISQTINSALKMILPPDSFHVMTNIALVQERIELKQEVRAKEKSKKHATPKEAPPGFEPLYVGPGETETAESSHTQYEPMTKIGAVHVLLLLDSSIPAEKKELALSIAKKKLQVSFEKTSSVEVKETNFERPEVPSLKTLFMNQIREKISSLLMLALLLVFTLLCLLLIFLFNRPKKALEPDATIDSPISKEPEPNSPHLDGSMAKVVDFAAEEPIVFKSFYKSLPQRGQEVFSSLIAETPFKDMVQDLSKLEFIENVNTVEADEANREVKKILSFIKQYKTLDRVVKNRAFGFLEAYSPDRVANFLMGRSNDEKALALSNLEDRFNREVLKHFPPQIKAEILKTANTPAKLSEINKRGADLERSLREGLNTEQTNISPITDRDIVQSLLNNDPHLADTVGLAKMPDDFIQKFSLKKYLLSFQELLAFESSLLNEIVNHLSNETVAHALVGQDESIVEKILTPASELRRKIIGNLINSSHVDKSAIEDAQNKFLKEYRRRI